MVTKEQAESIHHGDILYDDQFSNADGTPHRWRKNGKCHTWKRDPDRFKLPVKHGLYAHGYITNENCQHFHLTEEEAIKAREENK